MTKSQIDSKVIVIDVLTESLVKLLNKGFSYNDNIVSALHNMRADMVNEIADNSNYNVKFKKNGCGKCVLVEKGGLNVFSN